MPCDSVANREAAKRAAREAQMKALEQRLRDRSARIVRTGNRVEITGWTERGGWCDECAVRRLRMSVDGVVRAAVAAAAPVGVTLTFGHAH